MNERIIELAKKAGVLADYGEDIKVGRYSICGNYQSMEKFAELIVRECAKMAEAFHNHQYDFTGDLELYEYMKQHFGLE